MKLKLKICKGTGQAKTHGCGKERVIRKYGLCTSCYAEWLYNTDEGLAMIKRHSLKARKSLEKKQREIDKQKKEDVKKKSEFEKDLQTEINTIVRLLDVEEGCISCDHGHDKPWTRQAHAGHYYSVGSDPALRFNLLNIWKQCSICNNWKSGNERSYAKGLTAKFGKMIILKINSLRVKYKALHLTKEDLKEKIIIARQIKKRIKNGEDLSREQINDELKIYV